MVVAQQVFFLRKRDEVGCVLISCGKTASYTTVGNVLIKFEDCGRSYFFGRRCTFLRGSYVILVRKFLEQHSCLA